MLTQELIALKNIVASIQQMQLPYNTTVKEALELNKAIALISGLITKIEKGIITETKPDYRITQDIKE